MSEKPDPINGGNDYQHIWNALDTEDAYTAMEALNRIIAERDTYKAGAEKSEELVKIFEDGSKSIESKLERAKAERDELQDKAGWSYAEGWTARAELADKAKAEAEAEAGWMAKQEYDGGGAAYHQGFQDGVASCANKQLAKQLAKLKAERDEYRAALRKAYQALLTDNDQVSKDCDCRVCLLRREALVIAEEALAGRKGE